MRNDIVIEPAHAGHVAAIADRLRPSDIAEIAAASGDAPDAALMRGFETSHLVWTALDANGPFAMWGARGLSVLSETGVPWLLGTKELDRRHVEIARQSNYYVAKMAAFFPRLLNFIDARQTKSIRWLKWCGFHVEPAQPYGVSGLPFHKFWMGRP